ncbi:prepilin-type N-terminal cleavage/methylation domain-containing protein [Marinobacter persicus]|uniref:Prepilin-type N-terminal cleavage/methylation domain-containing protein n=1 Tax=Marinobacter persicus TaxID=930118 RepID=A0A1I3XB94_9GAMM|nr:prepilin-type N-terminal cleavage/methylation domain-containing protein [Marinobacter persicus]GHD48988.1 MSHA biogenesis protein MshB [Marinobacter persicus]SFK16852.1 prepilin-type N-terminal cleavage/methylation domain-containing protein [Marinobacter persicus]
MNVQRKNRGFTLIELVVVIAILAILAAFALPRFAQLSEQAHEASIKGTAGALSAGVALAKAQWVTNGSTTAESYVDGFGDFDFANGEGIAVNDNGWATSTNGITSDPNENRCVQIWEGLLQSNAPSVSQASNSDDTVEYWASADGSECTYEYQSDNQGSTIVYDTADGSVETTIN